MKVKFEATITQILNTSVNRFFVCDILLAGSKVTLWNVFKLNLQVKNVMMEEHIISIENLQQYETIRDRWVGLRWGWNKMIHHCLIHSLVTLIPNVSEWFYGLSSWAGWLPWLHMPESKFTTILLLEHMLQHGFSTESYHHCKLKRAFTHNRWAWNRALGQVVIC